jgi:digeranylgeranylglycerophospholipid reductase
MDAGRCIPRLSAEKELPLKDKIRIDRNKCCYCGGCVGVCPEQVLFLLETELTVDQDKCTMCRACLIFCPVEAISPAAAAVPRRPPEAQCLQTDVVIVGAGPAGSVCAKVLAQSGIDVLVVEKKQEIGVPKRCAEAVEPGTFEAVGIDPDPLWLRNRIQAAVLYAPNETCVSFGATTPAESGWIIERKIFDKHLAKDAIRAGARYRLKTTALGVIRENDRVRGIVVEHMGLRQKIAAKIVIAADGVDSMMAKSAGLDTVNRLKNYMSCFQYEMAGLRGIDDKAIHLYYGNDIAPGGYVWIFPKGSTMANVGVGIKTSKEGDRTAKKFLDRFIEKHPLIFRNASAVEFNSGGVPVRRTVETLVGDGLMIVGDAAQLVNSITGGGIKLAMISGKMAAEVAVESLKKGDVGRKPLSAYQKQWDAQHGKMLKKMVKLQRFTASLTNEDFNELAGILTSRNLEELAQGKFYGFVKLLLKELPSLAPLALKYLKS